MAWNREQMAQRAAQELQMVFMSILVLGYQP